MCGRFAITLEYEMLTRDLAASPDNDLPEVPNYNICPTNPVAVVRTAEGGRRLVRMRWGFLPHWYKTPTHGPLLINARAETVADKPAFRAAVRERRCLIPASGFFEWVKDAQGNRLPYYIRAADGSPLLFAGLWQRWGHDEEAVDTCAIVTCGANETMGRIHHRMPVVLAPGDAALWLGEAGKGAAALMRPAPEDRLVAWRVDPRVNSNRASGPDLIEPLADPA